MIVDRGGATAVEFALIMPPLLLLLFGIVEFGRLLWTQSAMHLAVQDAARCATVDTTQCGSPANIQAFAASRTAGLNLPSSVFTFTTPACGNQVAATYAFQFVVANLFPYAITLTAQSCFPK